MSRVEKTPLPDGTHGHSFHRMSGHELDRFLDFVTRIQTETGSCLGLAPPREMPVMIQLLRSHFRGRLETPSSLIEGAGLPRGTGHRMLEDMIARGLVQRRPRTRSGKTFSLHPSPDLIRNWFDYARRMKSLIGSAFGMAEGTEYFFGASYLSGSIIPPLPVMREQLSLRHGLRLLLHADPAFLAMQKVKQQFEMHFGTTIEVRALSIDRLRQEILENSRRTRSRFDIVTCDLAWMAEMVHEGALHPLSDLARAESPTDLHDFHPEALATARFDDCLFGLPVQTTPELLIHRTDLLAERGLAPPTTLEETLDAARRLHDPDRGISGICWNGARGTPVGTTFMLLMADFGQPVLNLPRTAEGFSDRGLAPSHLRPTLDSDTALRAAEYLVELLSVSPDNVLQMSWFERAKCYAEGRAAMAYCYTQIMPMFENDPASPAHGRTGYQVHPTAPGVPRMAPLGGWHLCIPANLPQGRLPDVWRAVRTLTSPAATKLYVENGSLVSSRFSVCNDPAVAHARPVIPFVDRIARAGQLKSWPRPAVPQLHDLVRVVGEEIHTMLLRNKKPAAALRDAQARCAALMSVRG